MSHRDIEDLLAERGITVIRVSTRLWYPKHSLRSWSRRCNKFGDTFYLDEVFVRVNGKQHCLWRAVDTHGKVIDVFLQARRDGAEHYRELRVSAFTEWERANA